MGRFKGMKYAKRLIFIYFYSTEAVNIGILFISYNGIYFSCLVNASHEISPELSFNLFHDEFGTLWLVRLLTPQVFFCYSFF